jgi:4-alpha-glucanotransferase
VPTIAGLWTGSDLEAQHRLDLNPNEGGTRQIRERLARVTRSSDRTPVAEVITRTHTALARAPSVVITATLEDAAGVEPRPNMPGTVTEWPNWSQPLPVELDALLRQKQTSAIATALGRRRRSNR